MAEEEEEMELELDMDLADFSDESPIMQYAMGGTRTSLTKVGCSIKR